MVKSYDIDEDREGVPKGIAGLRGDRDKWAMVEMLPGPG